MLESLVASLLNRFLGAYVKDFDPKQLNIGIWSGDVKLRDLQLRKEALDKFRLPVNVVSGHLGQLTLQIPWSNLKNKPVRVLIENVFILAGPKEDQNYDAEEEEQRKQAVKQEKVDSAEILSQRSSAGLSEEEVQRNQSFTESLVTKIVDNLQIAIKNIHVRYEDDMSAPGHPFAVGFTLSELSALSTDEDWNPAFLSGNTKFTHKLATLGALSFYWNTDTSFLRSSSTQAETFEQFKNLILTEESEKDAHAHQFVLRPVSGTGKIILNKSGSFDRPKASATLLFDKLGFMLDEDQYRDAVMMIDLFDFYIRRARYQRLRPVGSTPKTRPKEWLLFGFKSILNEIHEKNRKWSWAYFAERRDSRKRYIELYKKVLSQTVNQQEREEVAKLEWDLSYEDIRFYRSLTRSQLRKERPPPSAETPKQQQGWVSWAWSSVHWNENQEQSVMSEQQKRELYDAIEWDEKKAMSNIVDMPSDSVKFELAALLNEGSISLSKSPHLDRAPILSLNFDKLKAMFQQRPTSAFASVGLGRFSAFDGFARVDEYSQVVRMKSEPTLSAGDDFKAPEPDDEDPSLFYVSFENKPLDGSADTALTMKLREMEVIYNARLIESIVAFFKAPTEKMESMAALLDVAGATVDGLRQQTRAGLEFALQEHKTINARLDLQAPLIIVPEDCSQNKSHCLVIDAGHISLSSDLVGRDVLKDLLAKNGKAFADEEFQRLRSFMYDKFLLHFHSTQILIGPSIDEALNELRENTHLKELHIVDRINIDFQLEVSILPKSTSLTKLRVSGHLPTLHATLSDVKYKRFMRIIDNAIPKFSERKSSHATDATAENAKSPGIYRPRSFSFGAQEALLADDDAFDAGNEKFEEAREPQDDREVSDQKSFELLFTVDKLVGSLSKGQSDEQPNQPLATLILESFHLDVYNKAYELVADMTLKSLRVEDQIESSPEPLFKNLVYPTPSQDQEDGPLVHVLYRKVLKDSPEYMTVYDGMDQNVDVSISTLNLVVTRRSILTLLDFITTTFTNQEAVPQTTAKRSQTETVKQDNDDKIRVKVNLTGIVLVLNNDGVKMATITTESATVGVFLMGKTLRVGVRMRDFALVDNMDEGANEHSGLRRLISCTGGDLADFRYETFDRLAPNSPPYDSSIYLRAGSVQVNFVEEPFRRVFEYLTKFGQMKVMYDAAKAAAMNQASQIQETAAKIHFDIVVRTPIIVFPRMGTISGVGDEGSIKLYLGEIFAQNQFIPQTDSEDSEIINRISFGVRETNLSSDFRNPEDHAEELQILDKLDLMFNAVMTEDTSAFTQRPRVEMEGSMSDIVLKLTNSQIKFILDLSNAVTRVFSPSSSPDWNEFSEFSPSNSRAIDNERSSSSRATGSRSDTLGSESDTLSSVGSQEKKTNLDFVFDIHLIELQLYNDTSMDADSEVRPLTSCRLDNCVTKLRLLNDGSSQAEMQIKSFIIHDTRDETASLFREIVPAIKHDGSQFMASVSTSGGPDNSTTILLTVDSPKVIFAMDHVFAVQSFFSLCFEDDKDTETEDTSVAEIDTNSSDLIPTIQSQRQVSTVSKPELQNNAKGTSTGSSLSYRINVVDPSIVLIADPTQADSEAIVLHTAEILLSKQSVTALAIRKTGMSFCRMDKYDDSHLRILDDFDVAVTLDNRSPSMKQQLTSITVNVEPLVLRVSLRDMLLAMSIFRRASDLKEDGQTSQMRPEAYSRFNRRSSGDSSKQILKKRTASGRAVSVAMKKPVDEAPRESRASAMDDQSGDGALVKREELHGEFEGFRVVVIGDLHELPLLDLSVKRFTVQARDWSSQLSMETMIDTFVNVYNFSKSAWEPLTEPWTFTMSLASRRYPSQCFSVDLSSQKRLEVTVTTQTIAMFTKVMHFVSQTPEKVFQQERGGTAPYRIHNNTGYALSFWATSNENGEDAERLEDGEDMPYRFEDWRKMRETLTFDSDEGVIGVNLIGSGWDTVSEISVNREGESLHSLKPAKNGIVHQLLCEVRLTAERVKHVYLRSSMTVENRTDIPVEMVLVDTKGTFLSRVFKIAPKDNASLPINLTYGSYIKMRPDAGFGYDWCEGVLYWRHVLDQSRRCIKCNPVEDENGPAFYFQVQAKFDKMDPFARQYPHMSFYLHAPIEVQNLLPYDFKFRIYDQRSKKDWTNFLRKGGSSPVHVVQLSRMLLLGIDMQNSIYKPSEFAVISSTDADDFGPETRLVICDNEGLKLNLRLHYHTIPDGGGAFRVSVYSPYVILNKTGLDIQVKSKAFLQHAQVAAGQMHSSSGKEALPYMFSYKTDERSNRAVIRVGESEWSKPQSFEAIGSVYEVVIPSAKKQSEIHVGVSVNEGEGKYKLSKLVTISPRFVLKSKLDEDLNIREPGSSAIMTLQPGVLHPLHFLRQSNDKQLSICFPGFSNEWSSPFNITDLGRVHVKLAKHGEHQKLIQVELLAEGGTIFLHFSLQTAQWPFSVRNESDLEFIFYQADENENIEQYRGPQSRIKKYRIPGRSIMPYAWDQPAAQNKELVISSNGKERRVRLAEIGTLIPMKIHLRDGTQKIVNIDVVADGPTQTLVLSNYQPSKSLYRLKTGGGSSSNVSLNTQGDAGFEVAERDSDVKFRTSLSFEGIGVSLVNRRTQELAYITFRGAELKYSESKLYQSLSLKVKWIQIDNQLYGGIYPIVVYPSVVPKTAKEMESHPSFHASVTRVKDESHGVLYIKYLTVLLQQMTVEIDEDFLFAVLDFTKVPGTTEEENSTGKLCDDSLQIPEPVSDTSGTDVYFEVLHLQPAQMDLSFVRTERINVEDKTSSRNPLMFFFNVLTMAIGNINDAPVKLNALLMENLRVSMPVLLQNIQSHYGQEFFYQIHKILGSADFLGNPVGLFSNISSGVLDIFYEPYQGYVMSDRPQELGIGLAKGTASFVKKSVFGLSDSISKFTGSISKGLSAATLDKQFQDRRRISKSRNRPKHALYGVTAGASSLVTSFASGVEGLARQPLEGAEKEGASGFFKGVGKGLLGFATKPAVGIFDLASNITEGIRNTTMVFDNDGIDRVRLARYVGADGIIRPYSQREALGQFWLKQLDSGKYFNEQYLAHLDLPGEETVIMLTYAHILMIRSKRLDAQWDVAFKDVQTIALEKTGISLILRGGTQGPFIPIASTSSRMFLYKKIELAVKQYNSRFRFSPSL